MSVVTSNIVALWIALVVQFGLIVLVVRQLGLISLRLPAESKPLLTAQGLDLGVQAPDFGAMDLESGAPVSFTQFLGRKTLLFFVSPTCHPCHELLPEIGDLSRSVPSDIGLLLITSGAEATNREFMRQFKLRVPIWIQDQSEAVARLYSAQGITPFVYAIDEDSRVRFKGLARGSELLALVRLLDQPYHDHPGGIGHIVDLLEVAGSG